MQEDKKPNRDYMRRTHSAPSSAYFFNKKLLMVDVSKVLDKTDAVTQGEGNLIYRQFRHAAFQQNVRVILDFSKIEKTNPQFLKGIALNLVETPVRRHLLRRVKLEGCKGMILSMWKSVVDHLASEQHRNAPQFGGKNER